MPHSQSGADVPALAAEGERISYLLDGEFGSKVFEGVCGRIGREVRPMPVPGCFGVPPGREGHALQAWEYAPPILFFQKENAPRPVEEKKRDAAL